MTTPVGAIKALIFLSIALLIIGVVLGIADSMFPNNTEIHSLTSSTLPYIKTFIAMLMGVLIITVLMPVVGMVKSEFGGIKTE